MILEDYDYDQEELNALGAMLLDIKDNTPGNNMFIQLLNGGFIMVSKECNEFVSGLVGS